MTSDLEGQQVPLSDAMRLALDHHRAGRLRQAEQTYRAVLTAEPGHRVASHNLGLIALQTGRPAEALPALKAAVDSDPASPTCWVNYAVALAGSGDPLAARGALLRARQAGFAGERLDKLLAQTERMIASSAAGRSQATSATQGPDSVAAQRSALMRHFERGEHEELEILASSLGEQFSSSAQGLYVLGASRLVRKLNEEAHDALERAGRLAPQDPQILNLLGVALFRLARHDEAREAFRKSLERDPGSYDALVNAAANALGFGQSDEAKGYAERALAIRPSGVEALFALGNALAARGQDPEAVVLFRRATALDSRSPDLFLNLGNVLIRMGRPGEAAVALRQALALRPDYPLAHLGLGRALHDVGEGAEAQRHFRAASDLDPNLAEAHSAYLFSLAHDERITPQQSFEEHVRVGNLIEAPYLHLQRGHENDRDPEREIRIGFVSGDLLDHPVANLIEPVWRALKGGRNRIHAYSNRFSDDPVARRLRTLVDEWVDVERMSDEALYERIRADKIDILVDLSGHSARHRLPVFARKPAPIQISWIGYPGTTGLSAVDYRFARGLDQSATQQRLFREKLVYFGARGFQPAPDAPEVNSLPALSRGSVTFASFSRPSKLGEGVISLWSRVLLEVPDSSLLIAGIGDADLEEKLRASFGAKGVAQERLSFRQRLPLLEFLALHHEVDIVLDTFPYSGGTTAYHALWMGVPLLTLAGQTLQQNQSSLILKSVGMQDWIAETADAFVSRARQAASDLPGLASVRSNLREQVRLCFEGSLDASRVELEVAFRGMWKRWCAGLEAESFVVST